MPRPQDFSHLLQDQPPSSLDPPEDQAAEKALAVNEVLKSKLTSFSTSLQSLLSKVNEKFRINNMYLEMTRSDRNDCSSQSKRTYSKCGIPFFKDAHGDPCPSNEDYRYRKNVLKEFFPYEQPETRVKWHTNEKVKLIQGVRQQMISHIVAEQSMKLCNDSARRTRCQLQKLKFITNNKDLQSASFTSLYKTIQESFPDFSINWNILSFGDLNSTHSVSECKGMWYSYLNPDINRDPFSEDETHMIVNSVSEDTFQSWQDIAALLDNRSALQTYLRYTSICMKLCPGHVRWTSEEDQQLLDSIEKYSVGPQKTINWTKIGQDFPMRSKTQCYNRYLIICKYSKSKRGAFSQEEDLMILEFVNKHGEANISKMPTHYIHGRSITQIRNRYNMNLKKVAQVKPWTRDEDQMLMDFVDKNGCDFAKFATTVETHTRISCRTRYQTIKKFLDKNPNKTVADVPSRAKTTKQARFTEESSGNADEFVIIELDEPEKLSVVNRNVEKLRREHFELYCMFLPCFNLDFKHERPNVDDRNVITLFNVLKVQPLELRNFRKVTCSSDQLEVFDRLKKSFTQSNVSAAVNVMIPPCFSAAAALRALYVKTKDVSRITNESKNEEADENYSKHLEEFQQRFITMFYWTALAARINLEELKQITYTRNPLQSCEAGDFLITKKHKLLTR